MLDGLMAAQNAIETYAKAHHTLAGSGVGIKISIAAPDQLGLSDGIVSTNGVLIGLNRKFGVVAVLEPSLEGDKVTWRCTVMPKKSAPSSCRPA